MVMVPSKSVKKMHFGLPANAEGYGMMGGGLVLEVSSRSENVIQMLETLHKGMAPRHGL